MRQVALRGSCGGSLAPGGEGGYSVTLTGLPAPYVTWPEGCKIVLLRASSTAQDHDFVDNLGIKPSLIKAALDRLTRLIQEAGVQTNRAVVAQYGEAGVTVPPLPTRKGNLVSFDADTGDMRADRSLAAFDVDVAVTADLAEQVASNTAAAVGAANSAIDSKNAAAGILASVTPAGAAAVGRPCAS